MTAEPNRSPERAPGPFSNHRIAPFHRALLAALLLSVGLVSSTAVVGQPPPGYYDTVDTTSASTLRATLHDAIDDHTRFPYTSGSTDTWDILNMADEDPNDIDRIIDVYMNASYPKMVGGIGPYNREHTWPNSYGFPDDNSSNYPYTDCHHLFLSDAGYNTSRSNKPYRYCDSGCDEKETVFNDGRGGGTGGYPADSNWTEGSFTQGTWETWDGRKGDVARAILYMDIRYEGDLHGGTGVDEPDLIVTDNESLIDDSNTGDNEDVAYMGMLADLLQWHAEDPVDSREVWRNEVVFSFQGNRNPFIDHPEWAACLHSGDCDLGDLSVLGSCPGEITVSYSGGTPGGVAGVLFSSSGGSDPLAAGPCAGEVTELSSPQLLTTLTLDGNGELSLVREAVAGNCGLLIQVVDGATCSISDLATIP